MQEWVDKDDTKAGICNLAVHQNHLEPLKPPFPQYPGYTSDQLSLNLCCGTQHRYV